MATRLTITVIVLLPTLLQGQPLESLRNSIFPIDSINASVKNKLESIQRSAAKQYTFLRQSYDSTIMSASAGIDQLYMRIDSLQKLGRNTDHLTLKLDSLIRWKGDRTADLTSKVEKVKASVNERINDLNVPPELKDRAGEFTAMMNKLDITSPESSLPGSIQEYINMSVPDLKASLVPDIPVVDIDNPLKDVAIIDAPFSNVGDIDEQIKEHQGTISQLPKDLDGAAKLAEEQAGNISQVAEVQSEIGKIGELSQTAGTLQDQEKLKQGLVQEAQKQAIDHFADKKEHLDKVMQLISKYKQKFPTIGSLNDIPKKVPNEMKGKPLIERIVPGIAIQLQKKNDDLFVDINPYLAYRFTKRFSSGVGWNQRIGYNLDKNHWSPRDSKIYGPRLFSEYKIGKGFSPRLEVEAMNTFVPPYIKVNPTDPGQREWVWGMFVGIKKDYTLYKKIKGTALIMFRPFDPDRKSPYADVVNARFGFEFPMKKKVKAPK